MKIVDPEFDLLKELVFLIESSKKRVNRTVNGELNILFWQIGKRINEEILQNNRAEYCKQVAFQNSILYLCLLFKIAKRINIYLINISTLPQQLPHFFFQKDPKVRYSQDRRILL